ncbi:protein phosphatase 2C 51-like [Phoenix dactylifera]|uniref:protein-serine/threonine phosphatase n=1 Tax=Phoenix dactylifera TaxID=42345 RepID=A0A8B8IY89_PHODC|nr:protein phosphatase 2C 51-like [Phoenix dactylifera]
MTDETESEYPLTRGREGDVGGKKGDGERVLCKDAKMEGASDNKYRTARRRKLEIRRLRAEGRDGVIKRMRNRVENSDSSELSESTSSSSASAASPPSDPDADLPAAVLTAGAEGKNACVWHGAVSLIGRRREMEDAVVVAPPGFAVAARGYDFFGVYDGHGGAWVAQACRERLHVVLAEVVAAAGEERGEGEEGEEGRRWKEAMATSFLRVDGEVSEAAAGSGAEAAERTVGSTAVVAVVGSRRIVVANCGDSRAVLSRGGVAVALSSDHKPDRPDEMERVEAAGGRVINWNGYRVLGVLATSRSIGDYYLKPYVTSEPEVNVIDRTEKDEFLILASDGLWDVVSNEVACRLARRCLSGRTARMFPEAVTGRSAAEAAALLAELAISRGSKDNISVVVVDLKR